MRQLAILAVTAACAAPVQEKKSEPAPAAPPVAAPPARVIEESATVEYRAQAEGRSLVEVAAPAGAAVDVREGQALVARDVAPMSAKAEADHWYTVSARLPSGAVKETRVQARAGQVASVSFADSAPQGPQPMSREAFKDFVHAMDVEAGDEAKLGLLKSAAAHEWFTAAMAGVIIDHVVHRENKLRAVPIVKDRILDKENAFWLYEHFTYREDKARVQEMIEH
ncbi:MAG TPA: DUF4476 domain-containing protein [Myxococcales bacterium]|nr:DUF4476 domain-containing protein [Myxococcales bacterium]